MHAPMHTPTPAGDNPSPTPPNHQNRAARRAQQRAGTKPVSKYAAKQARYATSANPVAWAVMRANADAAFSKLKTDAGLQAYIGGDWATAVNALGRWFFIVSRAALICGNDPADHPELRVLAGAASAVADVHACPATLEQNRPALIRGMQAAAAVEPELPRAALIEAALQLDAMLASPHGLTLHDFTHPQLPQP